jgi:tRNA nucleotidyltransferase/poly(A) polymerase
MTHTLLEQFREYAVSRGIAGGAYIVGGAVRDMLLGKKPVKDVDIILEEDARAVAVHFADTSGATFVALDEELGNYRIVKKGEFLDLSVMRYKSLSLDLSERDLSINAMALPLISAQELEDALIDPFHGAGDLRRGLLRMVSAENFIKDPLRLLRVYRFMTTLGFAVEKDTERALVELSSLITSVSAERIAEELRLIIVSGSSYHVIKAMAASGILFLILPELECGNTDEALDIYRLVEEMINSPLLYFGEEGKAMSSYFSQDFRKTGAKLSSLFSSGETLVASALRLKMSRRETDYMTLLVDHRECVSMLGRHREDFSALESIRLLKNIRDDLYPLLLYALASRLCPDPGSSLYREVLAFYDGVLKDRIDFLPLITGEDLIREFHLAPSPLFGTILEAVEDNALAGSIASRQEALAFVKKAFGL